MSYKMNMTRPSSWWGDNWRDGTPIGNGFHGALVYGSAVNERIMLTHTRLWRYGRDGHLPDISDRLPEMRKLIKAGEIEKADKILATALHERGYSMGQPLPIPAADLCIYIKPSEGFSRYRRELDMNRAESIVSYMDGDKIYLTRSFVSRADDVIVVETDASADVSLDVHRSDKINEQIRHPEQKSTETIGSFIFFKAVADGAEHGAAVRVSLKGNRKLITCRIFYDGTHKEQWQNMSEYISALPDDYDILMNRHESLHGDLFGRTKITLSEDNCDNDALRNSDNRSLLDIAYDNRLPAVLAERMWAYGRYLFIISSAPDSLPCSLTSFFSGDYNAFWAINMANINLEMIYWNSLSGMIPEYLLSVFDYYESAMDGLRECARKLYGCRGIYLSAVSSPGALRACCPAPHIINWTGGGGWIGQLYYDYWLYTRDEKFLRNRTLPFLREVGLFYEDFIVWEGEGWHVYPSVSPENRTMDYRGRGYGFDEGTQTAVDAAMDIAIIKEVFTHLLELGKITNAGDDEIKRWQNILSAAPEYKFNSGGGPREWLDDDFADNELHRHQSHMYPAFPGLEFTGNEDMLARYRQGGIRRLTIGLEHQTSWSYCLNANLFVRCHDGANAYKCLWHITKSTVGENLFTMHNDWRDMGITLQMPIAPFQIDGNIGFTATIQEMLLFSDKDRIELLPALPENWTSGSAETLGTRCGLNIKLKWNDGRGEAELICVSDSVFELYLPNKKMFPMNMKKGEISCLSFEL